MPQQTALLRERLPELFFEHNSDNERIWSWRNATFAVLLPALAAIAACRQLPKPSSEWAKYIGATCGILTTVFLAAFPLFIGFLDRLSDTPKPDSNETKPASKLAYSRLGIVENVLHLTSFGIWILSLTAVSALIYAVSADPKLGSTSQTWWVSLLGESLLFGASYCLFACAFIAISTSRGMLLILEERALSIREKIKSWRAT